MSVCTQIELMYTDKEHNCAMTLIENKLQYNSCAMTTKWLLTSIKMMA